MSKKNKQAEKELRLERIKALYAALWDAGIHAEIDWNAQWYCIDDKVHYGIELYFPSGSIEEESFLFTPDGVLIYDCTKAPTKKNKIPKPKKFWENKK